MIRSQPPWPNPPPTAHIVLVEGGAAGYAWQDNLGRYCLVTGVTSGAPLASRGQQATLVLERMGAALSRAGFGFGHVVRTWYFLRDILGWYEVFNGARTRYLGDRGLLRRLPASTAVGMSTGEDCVIASGALAFLPIADDVVVGPVASPEQGSALDYGSSFSRAFEIAGRGERRLLVSGTASIDSAGRSLHRGVTGMQVEETLRVVRELLRSRGLDMPDVTRATCYLSCPEEVDTARVVATRCALPRASWVQATICRPELRFEVELIARAPAQTGVEIFW
jgi:enamine deaminase RidA (YjgF/YER057c/UK114 family)